MRTCRGREGWSWQRGEREVQGSLYCEVLRARAAIWLVRLGWRPRGVAAPLCGTGASGPGLGEVRGWAGCAPSVATEGHRGEEGTFLLHTELFFLDLLKFLYFLL